jgi:hypothetical protein
MTKQDSLHCSRCGSSDFVDARFAACVATSHWVKSNYPAPGYTYIDRNDDIRLWQIPLCRTCIPSGYRAFLRDRLKKVATQLGLCSFMLIVGVLGILFKIYGPTPSFHIKPLEWLFAAVITFAVFAGVIGVPVCTLMWVINFRRLKGLEKSGVVPAKQIDKSFWGEGQRIVKALMPEVGKTEGKVWGEFPLPEHRTHNLIEFTPEERKKLGNPARRRDIVAVGKTIDEVDKQLPSQWKEQWEKRNKNQSEIGKVR